MSFIAIIQGVSGGARYLRGRAETPDPNRAQRFRSEKSARIAARNHVGSFPPVVQRQMSYRVEREKASA